MSYDEMERQRSRKRYEEYLDEEDSSKLPNAFDLGWRRNLIHLFGPTPWLWFFPVPNTIGDGWAWEASPKWVDARDRLRREREEQRAREVTAGWGGYGADDDDEDEPPVITRSYGSGRHYPASNPSEHEGSIAVAAAAKGGNRRPTSKADRILGRDPSLYVDAPQNVPMARLSPRSRTVEEELDEFDDYDDDDDDQEATDQEEKTAPSTHHPTTTTTTQREEAERRALDVVTNGKAWGRGGASGMLRKQQHTPSPNTGVSSSKPKFGADDGVD